MRVTVGDSGLCRCTCVTYFWALINSLVCWCCTSALGLVLFQISDQGPLSLYDHFPLLLRVVFTPWFHCIYQYSYGPTAQTPSTGLRHHSSALPTPWSWWSRASCHRMSLTYLGQTVTNAEARFNIALRPQKPLRRFVSTESPGRPPRLLYPSRTLTYTIYHANMSDVHHSLNCQCCLLLKTSISNSDSLLFYTRLLMYAIPFCLDKCCTCEPYVDLKLLDCVRHHNWHGPTAFFNKPFRLRLRPYNHWPCHVTSCRATCV